MSLLELVLADDVVDAQPDGQPMIVITRGAAHHHDRHVGVRSAKRGDGREPRGVGQAEVQQDHIDRVLRQLAHGLVEGVGPQGDGVAVELVGQRSVDEEPVRTGILNDEHPKFGSVFHESTVPPYPVPVSGNIGLVKRVRRGARDA